MLFCIFLFLTRNVSFATPDQIRSLKSNREFQRYILKITCIKVQSLPALPEYRQIKHSQSAFMQLSHITQVIYENCLKQIPTMIERFDIILAQSTAECFYQCILVANQLYRRKIDKFLQTVGMCWYPNHPENKLIILNL